LKKSLLLFILPIIVLRNIRGGSPMKWNQDITPEGNRIIPVKNSGISAV
jgi:hypothetical protein